MCRKLASEVDTIRKKYWEYRIRKLEQDFKESKENEA